MNQEERFYNYGRETLDAEWLRSWPRLCIPRRSLRAAYHVHL